MGMEGFTPEPVVPEEVVAPDESERVDDVEKAQVMANVEDDFRDVANDFRAKAESSSTEYAKDIYLSKAESTDKFVSEASEMAGNKFDEKKQASARNASLHEV